MSQGPFNPGTLADDAGTGTQSWTNPGNAAAQDNTYAVAVWSGFSFSHYLKATNFGFSIGAAERIFGIKVEVERSAGTGGGACNDVTARLVKAGTIVGSNYNDVIGWPLSDTDVYQVYGGATDLWGTAWTPAEINASNFGFVFSASGNTSDGRVDHIRITVFSQEVGGIPRSMYRPVRVIGSGMGGSDYGGSN